MDIVVDDLWLFRIGDEEERKIVALEPGKLWEMVIQQDN